MTAPSSDLDKTTAVLRVDGVSVDYDGLTALRDAELTVRPGEVTAIFGESGSGKSVLFRCLTGLERPTRGRIYIHDQDLYATTEQKRLGLLRHLGVAHQTGALLKSLSVFENILLPLRELGGVSLNTAQRRVDELVERFKLDDFAHLFPAQLSLGLVKRVALARALALEPQILVCDDIFLGLTWSDQLKIFDLFADLSQSRQTSIVVLTPAPEVALKVGGRLVILDRGRVIASGRPDDIMRLADPAVERVFHSHLRAFEVGAVLPGRHGDRTPSEPEALT